MSGKTVLVTGGTGGIGRVAAGALARMGARVLLVGRSEEKTRRVVEEIRQAAGSEQVDYLLADLSLMSEVRRLAEEVKRRTGQLDVLVNNAGAVFMRREETAEGLEKTFALNHMAYFLLTYELLDLLKDSAPARVINVSSAAHIGSRLDLEDLQAEKKFSGWLAYSRSKLMNVYFTYELARQLKGTGVTANALHPGFVATNFGRSNGGFFDHLFRLFQVAAISPEKGAETIIFLASSPKVEGMTGKYFVRSQARRSSAASYEAETAARLWDASLEIAGVGLEVQMAAD